MKKWYGSFTKQRIDLPKKDLYLAGFAASRLVEQVHDDLFIRGMLVKLLDKTVYMISVDAICIEEGFYQEVLTYAKTLNISQEDLYLSATHSHSTPRGVIQAGSFLETFTDVFGVYDPDVYRCYLSAVKAVIDTLTQSVQPCTLRIGHTTIDHCYGERHDQNEFYDQRILVMEMECKDGKKGILYNLACHPTILNYQNRAMSNDLPYGISKHLAYDFSMFMNGAAGDISTRFTKKEATMAEVERIGATIAKAIMNVKLEPLAYVLESRVNHVTFKTKKVESYERLAAEREKTITLMEETRFHSNAQLRLLESKVEGINAEMVMSQALQDHPYFTLTFNELKLGKYTIHSVPGELYSSFLKKYDSYVFGYTNGYYLYLCDDQAYERGDYEAHSAVLKKYEISHWIDLKWRKKHDYK